MNKEFSPKCEFSNNHVKCTEDATYFIEFSSEVNPKDLKYFCEDHHNLLKENQDNLYVTITTNGSEVTIQ